MSDIFEWIANGFALTLIAAIATVPLALLVLTLDYTIFRRASARYRCLLWTLVAVRLLMPYAPESSLSLQNFWRLLDLKPESHSVNRIDPVESVTHIVRQADHPRTVGEWMSSPAAQVPARTVYWQDVLIVCLAMLWFVGLVVILLRAVIASVRFAWRLQSIPPIEESALVDQLLRVCDQVGVGRRPRLKYVTGLPAPALFGVLRPTICLPAETRDQLSPGQLRLIMLHEVMHLGRRDGLISWFLTVVQAVHWFNPIAWLTMKRIATYRELACDEAVRRYTVPAENSAYTELLLRFATSHAPANLGFVGLWFAQPVRRMAARIEAFNREGISQWKLPRLAMGGLIGLMVIVGLTDAASWDTKDAKKQSLEDSPSGGAPGPRRFEILPLEDEDKGFIEERIYDISRAMEKLEEAYSTAAARQHILALLKTPFLRAQSVVEVNADSDRIRVVMSQRKHEYFADLLDALGHSGPWQVAVETRVFHDTEIEAIDDIKWEEIEAIDDLKWEDAVKFALPTAAKQSHQWPERTEVETTRNKAAVSASVESVSWEYAPYVAMVLNQDKMRRVVERAQSDPRTSIFSAPKITAFNGTTLHIRDEAQRPFVVGVQYVKGELATAAQPEIAILSEGVQIEVQPLVIDANALELRCRLTMSHIDGVSDVKLPGKDIVVQNPRASRKVISATCRVASGETLLIAPIAVKSNGNGSGGFYYYAITPTWFLPDAFNKVAGEAAE